MTHRCFRSASGGAEHFFIIRGSGALPLADQIKQVETHYAEAQKSLGLAPETAVFRRLFVSDAINQAPALRASALMADSSDNPVAVSLVQQSPLPDSKLAMLAYHIESPRPLVKKRLSSKHVLMTKNGFRHLWSTNLCAGAHAATSPEEVHTREAFRDLMEALGKQVANLRDHCVRTWLFLKDVDVFYRGMVSARRELFIEQGLTENTHYIASTGIEGSCEHQFDLVMMDAYSIPDLVPRQMSYLNDFDYLCPTKDYTVTFERGTRIAYRDRAHSFISGTASIDKSGNVLHIGDIRRQFDRTLENIERLLRSGGASFADMMYLIVYLRDTGDSAWVREELARRYPELPCVVVRGPVCRPEWLIEMEGVAIAEINDPALPEF